jgi:hypothetical protein
MKMQAEYPHKQFAKKDEHFRAACEMANIKPTRKQASKWRKGTGRAWKAWRGQA